ncbi:hypothetical protein NL676_020414 [Syzygium grande]|nr:hypothetical protein NL676_020414 [Syzygium grande]
MQGRNQGNYRNPCLTMHQPWASLLVYGIERIEGRPWPAPIGDKCIDNWNVLPMEKGVSKWLAVSELKN